MELNEKLFNQMSNKMISSNKGTIGENLVIDWLTEYYPLSGLAVTAKKGKKADMVLELDNNKYLVEVKNFKHNVPKRDIEKFEQEMMKIEEIQAGLFISTNSNIQGREDWEIRHYNGRPGIFLTNVSKYLISLNTGIIIDIILNYSLGACLLRILCKVLLCILNLLAVSETFLLH